MADQKKGKVSTITKDFDLNIEKILEDWEIYHGVREIIANALDEQFLTKTNEIEIFKDDAHHWHIRDFGRGLKYTHLTQNEDPEKTASDQVIGKFGIGLKDALATFERHGIKCEIHSKFGIITLKMSQKHGFDDLITLHASIAKPIDPNFIGTDFVFANLPDDQMKAAKGLFLKFSGDSLLEDTKYGAVLKKKATAKIYINGVKVNEEQNFLFSYNITSLTANIRKALNRERTNVGRNAYSERVKSILLNCKSEITAELMVKDIENYEKGTMHDELQWIDVQTYAIKILNSKKKIVFLNSTEAINQRNLTNEMENMGYKIMVIPDNLKQKIQGTKDIEGNPIVDLRQFRSEYNQSFQFNFIDITQLTPDEKRVFESYSRLLDLIDIDKILFQANIHEILISENMRIQEGVDTTLGLYERETQRIIIKREQLKKLSDFAGTFLHEVAHAMSGEDDVSQDFETFLTDIIGKLSQKLIRL
jgi:hypothetical protein